MIYYFLDIIISFRIRPDTRGPLGHLGKERKTLTEIKQNDCNFRKSIN